MLWFVFRFFKIIFPYCFTQRRETRSLTSDTNSVDEAVTEQAVNLQRQRLGESEAAAQEGPEGRRTKTIKQQYVFHVLPSLFLSPCFFFFFSLFT